MGNYGEQDYWRSFDELQKFRALLFVHALAEKFAIWLQILFKTENSQLHVQIENYKSFS